MKSITLIGSGNVATHLGLALRKNGYHIAQIYSRSLSNAEKLSKIAHLGFVQSVKILEF